MRPESSEAFSAGERIAKRSVITLLMIGFVQIPVGLWTGSVGLTADGVDSICDSLVSLIVWVGLHFARRRPDARFHFGYQKVESLSALIMSMVMVAIASYIFYHSYRTFLAPETISYPFVALATLLGGGIVSLYRAFQMRSIARKYGLLSLRIDADNSMKDGTSSFVVFASVLAATVLGIHELDAVAGMIISIYIIAVAYVAFRESSLTLLDAYESPVMTRELRSALQTVDGVRAVSSIRLRPSGPYVRAMISVLVDESMTVARTEQIRNRMMEIVHAIVEPIDEVTIVFRAKQSS